MFELRRDVYFVATAEGRGSNNFRIHASVLECRKEPGQLADGIFELERKWRIPIGPWRTTLKNLQAADGVDQDLGARIVRNAQMQIEFGIYDRY